MPRLYVESMALSSILAGKKLLERNEGEEGVWLTADG